MKRKNFKYLMLGITLASSTFLLLNSTVVQAADSSLEIEQIMNENISEEFGIYYEDSSGSHFIPAPEGTKVNLTGTVSTINLSVSGKNYTLSNVSEVTFKGITVNHLIPFYLHGVKKVTLDQVNFTQGIDFSGMKDLESLVVMNSNFGSLDYSLAIHVAPNLTEFIVDNSTFNADLRIYSNNSLEVSHVSNSVFKKDVSQYSNHKGYTTDFVNNRFERNGIQRVINSGGMSRDDIFVINQKDTEIGKTAFDNNKDGFVAYVKNGKREKINVSAGNTITSVVNLLNTVSVKLSSGENYKIDNPTELYFRNVDIKTPIAFTQAGLKLDKISFVNSRTQLIDVAYSTTIKNVQIIGTEISQSSGYLSIYNNSTLESVEIQDSEITGTSGYISVYNNKSMNKYVMNNVYTHGYLSAYSLGNTVLQIGNSLFDDYISTNQVIEGEGEPAIVGYLPEFKGVKDITVEKGVGNNSLLLKEVTVEDFEDGDITSNIEISGVVNWRKVGTYPITYTITDSDGNKVSAEIVVNVV